MMVAVLPTSRTLGATLADAEKLLESGRYSAAEKSFRQLAHQSPKNRLALYISASVALRNPKQRKEAEAFLDRLVAAGGDGYFAREALGRLALKRGDLSAARKHLLAAMAFEPENGEPHRLLARAHKRAGRIQQAIDELKALVVLKQHEPKPALELVDLLARSNEHAGVHKYGEMAFHRQPGSARLHIQMATAYDQAAPVPDIRRAIWHLETALLCHPEDPKAIRARLATLHRKARAWRKPDGHRRPVPR